MKKVLLYFKISVQKNYSAFEMDKVTLFVSILYIMMSVNSIMSVPFSGRGRPIFSFPKCTMQYTVFAHFLMKL